MVINLRHAFNVEGSQKSFDFEIPLEELSNINGYDFITPIKVKGVVTNRTSVVTVNFTTDFTLKLICDRCLKELDRSYFYEFDHIVVKSVNNDNDDYIVAVDESIDLNNIATSDLLLQLPSKNLCDENCKGLCTSCGCDLNEEECNCIK
jgi:uncharacterized protein